MAADIPFNRPSLVGNELEYVARAARSGHLSGDGSFAARCHEILSDAHGGARAFLTPSCTAALEMSALLLDIQPGDEVLVPSFAFVTTANAYALFGARPVFCDVLADSLTLDPEDVERKITGRTRAIVALHYAGVGRDIVRLQELAEAHNLILLEDNAHGLFGRFRDRPLGTFGAASTLSFHETKNFSCGEGGALIVNRESWVERAEILREKGTNRSRFFRGQVDKYTWVDLGSSYLPSELQAAFLLGQLEARDLIQTQRARIWNHYHSELKAWAHQQDIKQPIEPDGCESTAHIYHLLLPDISARTRFIEFLRERGVLAVFHYQPLHRSRMGIRFGSDPDDCPISVDVADRLVRLPLFNDLEPSSLDRVIEAVLEFRV